MAPMGRAAFLFLALAACGPPDEDALSRLKRARDSYRLDRPEAFDELVSVTFEHPELKFDDGQWASDLTLTLALDLLNLKEDWSGMYALMKRVEADPVLSTRAAAQRERARRLE